MTPISSALAENLYAQAQLTKVAPENFPGDETIVRRYIRGVPQE